MRYLAAQSGITCGQDRRNAASEVQRAAPLVAAVGVAGADAVADGGEAELRVQAVRVDEALVAPEDRPTAAGGPRPRDEALDQRAADAGAAEPAVEVEALELGDAVGRLAPDGADDRAVRHRDVEERGRRDVVRLGRDDVRVVAVGFPGEAELAVDALDHARGAVAVAGAVERLDPRHRGERTGTASVDAGCGAAAPSLVAAGDVVVAGIGSKRAIISETSSSNLLSPWKSASSFRMSPATMLGGRPPRFVSSSRRPDSPRISPSASPGISKRPSVKRTRLSPGSNVVESVGRSGSKTSTSMPSSRLGVESSSTRPSAFSRNCAGWPPVA